MRLYSFMYRSHLKVFIKTILRNKIFSLINLFGLTVGFAVALLVWIFVSHELTYDQSFEQSDRIYRVIRDWQGNEKFETHVPAPLAGAMVQDFPEVLSGTRLSGISTNMIIRDRDVFNDNRVQIVDSTFFSVFGIDLITGNTHRSLSQPGSVVVSASSARKLFGKSYPMGQVLTFETTEFGMEGQELIVTGIFEDFPVKSHMRPDFLVSSATYDFMNNPSHRNHFLQTYILLQSAEQKEAVESKLPGFMKDFYGEDYYNYSGSTYLLQAIQDIHLNARVDHAGYETSRGNYTGVYVLPALALFILLICVINFINLYTSQSLSRSREVWLKKINGATARQETVYFLADSVILFLIGFCLALCLIEIILPAFASLVDRPLERDHLYRPVNLLLSIFTALGLGVISGLYPATALVTQKIYSDQDLWKGFSGAGVFFNSKLIILQFAICILFLICSTFIYKQFRFINAETNHGFRKENMLVIRNPGYLGRSHAAFKDLLLRHKNISGVTSSESVPGIDWFSTWGHPVDSALNDSHISVFYCDYDFAETMELKMVQGRFLSREYPTDHRAMVLNEVALRRLGWDDPMGKRYRLDTVYHVVGVIRDIHYMSLHNEIEPLGMVLIEPGSESFITIRLKTDRADEVLGYIRDSWKEFVPDRPLEYSFVDKEFDFWYKTDRRLGIITILLSVLAIVISILGLVGLMMYSIIRRTKEIGIRKVNGATASDIFLLFIRDTSKWLLMGFIIAVPFSWFLVNKWLQGFAYKTTISWWIFILAGLAVYVISIASIFWQCHQASRQNTVNSLRYE